MDDSQIDPQILNEENNPALRFLRRLQDNPRPSNAVSSDPPDLDSDPEDAIPLNPSTGVPSGNSLVQFGRIFKRHMKLTVESETDFDNFCSNPSPEERMAILYATLLESRDEARRSSKAHAELWVMSEELKKNIRIYTQAFMLSPTTTSYRGDGSVHILKAMRELQVPDIPPEREVARVKTVLAAINKSLTAYRNVIKEKIKASTEPGSAVRNIADLVHSIIANTSIQPTLQLYMRIALLRWHILEYPNLGETDWWPQVDSTMVTFRTKKETTADILDAFNQIYIEDKERFGDPADTTHQVVAPKNISGWLNTVNAHAAKVQGARSSKERKTRQE